LIHAPIPNPDPKPTPESGALGWMLSFFEKHKISLVEYKEKYERDGRIIYLQNGEEKIPLGGLPDVERTYATKPGIYYTSDAPDRDHFTAFGRLAFEIFNEQSPFISGNDTWKHWLGYTKSGTAFHDHRDRLAQNPVITAHNVFYIMDTVEKKPGGSMWYKVKTLQISKMVGNKPVLLPYPDLVAQLDAYPFLATKAVISLRGGQSAPFGHLDGRDVKNLIFSHFVDYDWLPADRIVPLEKGSPIPHSY
jgi:hypothetical protein